jgi:hypothetical protein
VLYYHHLAGLYADSLNEPEKAVEWARKDLALRQNIYAWDALAWAEYRNGNFAEARKACGEAMRTGVKGGSHTLSRGYDPDELGRYRGWQNRAPGNHERKWPATTAFMSIADARLRVLLIGMAVVRVLAMPLAAHPVAQGAMDILVLPETVVIKARVANEQVFVAETLGSGQATPANLNEAWLRHGDYLLEHIRVVADDVPLGGRVANVQPSATAAADGRTSYELHYDLPQDKRQAAPGGVSPGRPERTPIRSG